MNDTLQNLIEGFIINEDNINKNIELLKNYSINNFIKYKNMNNINDILIDDALFLSFYNTIESIKTFRKKYFKYNIDQYNKMNFIFNSIDNDFKIIIEGVINFINFYLNSKIYDDFIKNVDKYRINILKNDTIYNLIVKNESTNHGINYDKNTEAKNKNISLDKKENFIYFIDKEEFKLFENLLYMDFTDLTGINKI